MVIFERPLNWICRPDCLPVLLVFEVQVSENQEAGIKGAGGCCEDAGAPARGVGGLSEFGGSSFVLKA